MGGRGSNSGKHGLRSLKIGFEDVLSEYETNATPGIGSIIQDNDFVVKDHQREIAFASWILDTYGGDIRLLQEHNKGKGNYNPDYLWNGRLWDLKTVSTEKSANAALKHGHDQIKLNPGGIMLDFGNNQITKQGLHKVIDERVKWYHNITFDIMVVQKGKTVMLLRYKR